MFFNKSKTKGNEGYYQEAKTWDNNKTKAQNKSERRAWIFFSVAMGVIVVQQISFTALLPLKTIETVVVRVDNAAGTVDVVNKLANGETNYDEAINKFFLAKYILYREGYSRELFEEFYNAVGLMSDTQEQQKYYAAIDPKNPRSPVNVYGTFAKARISIKSISFLKPDIASIRYMRTVERGMDSSNRTHWVATVNFKYVGKPMKESDRLINPLGFQEVDYRNDPDSVQDTPANMEQLSLQGVNGVPKAK